MTQPRELIESISEGMSSQKDEDMQPENNIDKPNLKEGNLEDI